MMHDDLNEEHNQEIEVPIEPEKLSDIKELFELFKKPMGKAEGELSEDESVRFFIDLQHVRESKNLSNL